MSVAAVIYGHRHAQYRNILKEKCALASSVHSVHLDEDYDCVFKYFR